MRYIDQLQGQGRIEYNVGVDEGVVSMTVPSPLILGLGGGLDRGAR